MRASMPSPPRDPVTAEWAAARGVALTWPEDYVRDPDDFAANPCIDFGRVVFREPRFVLAPRDADQLVACMAMLRERAIPYHVRGGAHSSGGQPLSDGGAVIDTRALSRIVDDRPDAQQIVVEGGATWLAVIEHLLPQGRRPLALTGNPRVTVAGTLAVGGFGDTTHLDGLVIRSVDALTLLAPDGTRHALRRGDELLRYVLAGRGQLGVIADATLRTVKRPLQVALRYLRWGSVRDFVRDAETIFEHRLYEYVRARIHWTHDVHVEGAVGNFVDAPTADHGLGLLRPIRTGALEVRDLVPDLRRDPRGTEWQLPTPAMEIALPLPDGLRAWRTIREQVFAAGLVEYLGRGTSVMVVPPEPEFPLAPVTARHATLLIALRPEAPAERARALLPALRKIGETALAAGGRIYQISIELESRRFVERQLGETVAARFRALKAQLDPSGVCNPGLL
jgi:FAD/FMN-containing dehydrogenase